jgi:hypothetical protein
MTTDRAWLLSGVSLLLACGAVACSSATDAATPSARPPGTSVTPPTAETAGDGLRVSPGAQAYVDSVNAGDLDALVAAFAADGEVVDVTRRIRGPEAIRAWAGTEVIGGSLRVDGVDQLAPDRQRLRVHWAPAGSAGWAADYTFTTRGGQITVADLQYAG